jgi:GNAT superfamily N-acetyltransferase
MSPVKPLKASAGQISELTDTAAAAFMENPLFNYIIGDKNPEKYRRYFRILLKNGFRLGEVHYAHSPEAGFIITVPRSKRVYRFFQNVRSGGLGLLRYGPGIALRSLKTENALKKLRSHYLPENHLYVYLLAVHPGSQNQGIGGSLLSFAHRKALEKERTLCLETMTEENLNYYLHWGFKKNEEVFFSPARLMLSGLIKNLPQ